jgi:hypothetical protein
MRVVSGWIFAQCQSECRTVVVFGQGRLEIGCGEMGLGVACIRAIVSDPYVLNPRAHQSYLEMMRELTIRNEEDP